MSIVVGNITTSPTAAYVSVNTTAVTFMSICNYTVGNVIANVYVVPNGGTAGNSNIVLSQIEITAQDTYQFYAGNEKLILANGDSIQVDAAANNAITTVTSYTSV